jgi:hypothetical protein
MLFEAELDPDLRIPGLGRKPAGKLPDRVLSPDRGLETGEKRFRRRLVSGQPIPNLSIRVEDQNIRRPSDPEGFDRFFAFDFASSDPKKNEVLR